MIKKPNSLTLMEKIDEAVDNIKEIKSNVSNIKKQMETKVAILNTYFDVANATVESLTSNIKEKTREEDTIIFGLDLANNKKMMVGSYSAFGQTIHPRFTVMPDQMFNFISQDGPLFKDNAEVSFTINGEKNYKYEYCNILKEESDDSKLDVFLPFETNVFTLSIETKPSNLIGNSACNMIEIAPYLPGTFDIDEIRIWTIEQYMAQDLLVPDETITKPFLNVCAERIMLKQTYQIYKIEFDITLHMPSNVKNYFGLRHIYFYNAKMDKENSYVIMKIKKNGYIRSIGNNLTIKTPNETKNMLVEQYRYKSDTPATEFFMVYENDTLQGQIDPSVVVARNISEFYAKIPIFESINTFKIGDITLR